MRKYYFEEEQIGESRKFDSLKRNLVSVVLCGSVGLASGAFLPNTNNVGDGTLLFAGGGYGLLKYFISKKIEVPSDFLDCSISGVSWMIGFSIGRYFN